MITDNRLVSSWADIKLGGKASSCLWNSSAFMLLAGRICLLTWWTELLAIREKRWFQTIFHGSINCKYFSFGVMVPNNLWFSHLYIKWLLVMRGVPSPHESRHLCPSTHAGSSAHNCAFQNVFDPALKKCHVPPEKSVWIKISTQPSLPGPVLSICDWQLWPTAPKHFYPEQCMTFGKSDFFAHISKGFRIPVLLFGFLRRLINIFKCL